MLRKAGFTEEDIIKETKKIMPFVKHVHITDNFGYSDSHLPPGMGNVPIKQFREELEKQGYSGRAIMEIGGWAQHFPTEGAYLPILTGIESPLYKMEAPPYWSEISNRAGSYYAGLGEIYPQQHHEMYGSSFTTLPQELGGQAPSNKSRFSDTPTE